MIILVHPGKVFRQPGSQLGSFGDKFRTERERRGFTLDDVSNVTKINSRMLKAIEEEHFDLLPGGVFNKGFVRAYAKHLGFNDEESVGEYLAALRQAQIQAQTAIWQADVPPQARIESASMVQGRTDKTPVEAKSKPAAITINPKKNVPDMVSLRIMPEVERDSRQNEIKQHQAKRDEVKRDVKPEVRQDTLPPHEARESAPPLPKPTAPLHPPAGLSPELGARRAESIPWKVPAVVLAVILLAAVLWNRHSRGVQADAVTATRPPESQVMANNSAASAPATTTAARNPASLSGTNPAAASNPQRASNRDLLTSPSTAPAARERNAAPEHSADQTNTDRVATDPSIPDRDITVRRLQGASGGASAPPVFTLRIRASETSWIAVSTDGKPEIRETLIAPASTFIRASREITVKVGNAAGVSFLINGKEIPPQGSEAEVKTLSFDSAGMREAVNHTPSPDPAR